MSTENTVAVEAFSSNIRVTPRREPPSAVSDTPMEIDSEKNKSDPNAAVFSVQPDWYMSLRYVNM